MKVKSIVILLGLRFVLFQSILLAQAPPAPSIFYATPVSNSQIDVQWNDVSGEDEYVLAIPYIGWLPVYWETILPANTTTFSYTGLTPNSERCFYIYSRNSYGSSNAVGPSCATTFNYSSFISLTSPNGGENWTGGSIQFITWNDNFSENVKIELLKSGVVHSTITSSTASNGSYTWPIPANLMPCSDYKVRISSVSNTGLFDVSDADFTIGAFAPVTTLMGTTRFDMQTNLSVQNRIYYYPDGTIGSTYMLGSDDPSFPDRGTGYNYFDGTNWSLPLTTRIENVKTGWPSYAPYGSNGEIMVTHTSATPAKLLISKRTNKGVGTWIQTEISGPSGSTGLLWPRIVTNGTNKMNIHLLTITTPTSQGGTLYQGLNGALIYNRSIDGGNTWSGWQILPGMDATQYIGFGGDSYSLAEPKGDTLCFTVGNNWNDQFLMKSTNNGVTWTKSIIWHCLYNKSTVSPVDSFYCSDGNMAVALDGAGQAHVVFGRFHVGFNGSQKFYYPNTDGLIYWNESQPELSQNLDSATLVSNGNWLANVVDGSTISEETGLAYYRISMTSMPNIVIDDNDIYVIWSSVSPVMDQYGYHFRHIYAKASNNGGESWCSNILDLCDTPALSNMECVYPSVAARSDNNLYMSFQVDSLAGSMIRNSGIQIFVGQNIFNNNRIEFMSIPKSAFIFESAPAQPGIISGNPTPCQGSTQIYSVTNVAGINYNWTFPSDWTQLSGGTSNSVSVLVGSQEGMIQVTPSNECGNGPSRTMAVNPDVAPGPASQIYGQSLYCNVPHTQELKLYYIDPVPGATSYEWSIDGIVQVGETSEDILLPYPLSSFMLSVRAMNDCGFGLSSSKWIEFITVEPTITGPDFSCVGAIDMYYTESFMTNYLWTYTGGNVVGGGALADNFIIIQWIDSGPQKITVDYTNFDGCNAFLPTEKTVLINASSDPVIFITASANPVCMGTPVEFSAIVSDGGTNPVYQWQLNNVDIPGATDLTYSYTPSDGDLIRCILTTSASCVIGSPASSNIITMEVVSGVLPAPGEISGPSEFCQAAYPAVMWPYTIDAIPGATSYLWTIIENGNPVYTEVTSENMIELATPTTTFLLTVNGVNSCGISPFTASKWVIVHEVDPTINGPASVCADSECIYQTEPNKANYLWTVSSDATILEGGALADNFITVRWNLTGNKTVSINYNDDYGCTAWTPTLYSVVVNPPCNLDSVLGITRYDLQTNASGQNRLYMHPDGTLAATFTMGILESTFPDRGTGYNYFNGMTWSGSPAARIENVRTGWPSYSPFGANGELVVTHTSDSPTKLMLAKRTTKGTGDWSFSELQGPSSTVGVLYPRVVTNGLNHTNIHILAYTTLGPNGGYIVYNRSLDGGVTWNGWQILPGMDSTVYSGFREDACSFAQPKGDTLCFTLGTNWCDQILMKSTNNGTSWTKTVIWPSLYNLVTSNLPIDTFYCADRSNAIAIDHNGKAHVVFGRNKVKSNGTVAGISISDGLIYWNEDKPQLPQSLDSATLVAGGNWLANIPDQSILSSTNSLTNYGLSLTSMPSMVFDNDHLYVVWTSVTSYSDINAKKLRHIFAKASNDGGSSWCSNTLDLCNSSQLSGRECIYPSFASRTSAEDLYLIFQQDSLAGLKVINTGGQTVYDNNQIQFMSIPKSSFIFGNPPSQPGPITGNVNPCYNAIQNYSVPAESGVNYLWSFPSGWVQIAGGESNTITVIVGEGSGSIQVIPSNGCGNGPAQLVGVIPKFPPNPAGPIFGQTSWCSNWITTLETFYSIDSIPGASSYVWSPEPFMQGQGTTVVEVPSPPGNVLYSVYGINECGAGAASSLWVETFSPRVPTINGPDSVCLSSQGDVYFTESGMTNYTWNVSEGGTITSGGSSNVLTVVWNTSGNKTVSVAYNDENGCIASYPTVFNVAVSPLSPVSISILASSNPFQAGTSVTFTANPLNGGSSPQFQWKVNGAAVGTNSPTYNYFPENNDNISCILTSNQNCISGNPATSNVISMTVTWTFCPGIPTVLYGGKTYNTVQIGNQCWFKENLNIGTRINGIVEQSDDYMIEKYCFNDLESNCDIYGGLYQWNEAMQYNTVQSARGICPTGWHIPADAEWSVMLNLLNGVTFAGGKMKEPGILHWASPNIDATNSSGFTAFAGGGRSQGSFSFLMQIGYFWSSTFYDNLNSWRIRLRYDEALANQFYHLKSNGFSIRCMMDELVPTIQPIGNTLIPNGQSKCYNATQTITVAGNGTFFTVLNGGAATMIAGQNILYYPGTTVITGAYMHGYIAPGGPYCVAPALPSVVSGWEEKMVPDLWSFRIYPNPTSSRFILDLSLDASESSATIHLYNMMGVEVYHSIVVAGKVHELTLENHAPGLYMIRVEQHGNRDTQKIIRQ